MADDALTSPLTDTPMGPGDLIPALRAGRTVHFSVAQLPSGGSTGPAGPSGPPGPAGPTGPIGPAGSGSTVTISDGSTTISGAESITFSGATLTGDSTSATVTGLQGIQGLTGADGATGPAGADGATGPQGPQGDPGPTGATGATGSGSNVTVTDGSTTISGASQITFSGATLTGNSSNAVVTGLQGATGATGPQGSISELSTTALTANSTPFTLPANGVIHYVIFRETAGHNISVGLGTSSGSNDLMSVQAVTGHSVCYAMPQQMNDVWLSATNTTPLYINSGNWGSASINVKIGYTVGP
jgi:hypothetical protein